MTKRRFNTRSSLTFDELSGIISELRDSFKENLYFMDSNDVSDYRRIQGKIQGLDILVRDLEEFMQTRHIEYNDQGENDEF